MAQYGWNEIVDGVGGSACGSVGGACHSKAGGIGEEAMRNFPKDFRRALNMYFDGKGTLLQDRVKRLNAGIDAFWQNPGDKQVRVVLNRRISKLFRGLNYNHLFRQRFEFNAVGVGAYDAKLENDDRSCIVLDENNLEGSFDAVRPIFDLKPSADDAGSIVRGVGMVFLNYFVLHLYCCALACCREENAPPFPKELMDNVEGVISDSVASWCGDTVLRDRLLAIHVVWSTSLLTPDQKKGMIEVCRLMGKIETPKLVSEDIVARIRICELYHGTWPYLMGKRVFRREGAEQQKVILRDIALLAGYLCRHTEAEGTATQAELEIRQKVTKRLMRAVGMKNDELGWHLYRELREGDSHHRFRSDHIFGKLLDSDKDRLAVLNVVYEHKKRGLTLSDPKRKRVRDMIMKKYQHYFSDVLELDKTTDMIELVHEESRLDLEGLEV